MISNKLLEEIDRGRLGLNKGIPMGLPKLEGIIDGVTRETYTLILSNSGSGKTSFALYAYVYKPLMQHLDDDDFKILFFSLEMNELSLYIKLLSIYLFETFGIQISFKEILSRKKEYILSDEHYELIQQCLPWIDKISKKLEIYDKSVSANTVYAILKSRLESIGKFVETDTRLSYIPNNPNLIYNVVIDHIGLVRPQQGHSLKQEIDLLSSYLVTLREKCGISPVVIQQANREQGNIERFKQGKSAFTINDAKDSGNTVQDCNIMLALYNPNRDSLKTYKKYNIEILENNFRSLMVLKNRYGDCDVEIGMNFFGGINTFAELPKPDEIYDYETYTDPTYLLQDNTNEKLDETENNFNFVL
jgi:replicative DNA helicase